LDVFCALGFLTGEDNAMNPHGLLIAYAESTVKPVRDSLFFGTAGWNGSTGWWFSNFIYFFTPNYLEK